MFDASVVITNCTGRKRGSTSRVAMSAAFAGGGAPSVASAWASALRTMTQRVQASDFYAGRSFSEAKRVARLTESPLHVVSAGLGLIDSSSHIPPYDLTISSGENSVMDRLSGDQETSSDWWNALHGALGKNRPFHTLLVGGAVLALIALPSTYMRMVQDDLDALPNDAKARLRLFTSSFGASELPPSLKSQVMPYDERLEGSSYSGTRTDFPQRAMRHFVEDLQATELPTEAAAKRVLVALQAFERPEIPRRIRLTDEEIRIELRAHWDRLRGSSSRLLRHLRDTAGIACEQGRFRTIWQSIRAEGNQVN
jgi:hypothetical protein